MGVGKEQVIHFPKAVLTLQHLPPDLRRKVAERVSFPPIDAIDHQGRASVGHQQPCICN